MTCYSPLTAYRAHNKNDNGTRSLVFNPAHGARDRKLSLPCGQCIGCRLEYSRQWAMRCVHEASLYDRNCFITLTYNDEHLPPYQSLRYYDFQLFFKRLRKRFGKARYFMAGEYGDINARPHYHAIIFGLDFAVAWGAGVYLRDRHGNTVTALRQSSDYTLYQSSALDLLWSHPDTGRLMGHASVGQSNFATAAYVARYITGKITGDLQWDHYAARDDHGNYVIVDDEIVMRATERAFMSRRPGIGHGWITKFLHDVYKDDTVIINGKPVKPPRYYDRFLSDLDLDSTKLDRKRVALRYKDNNTIERLRVRETVKRAQISSLTRDL